MMEVATPINVNPELFYDPFAEEGNELYDADVLHEELAARYLNNEISHDYTSDNFVKDTETAMMTAHFNEQFDAMHSIMQRMHLLCGEDHELQQQVASSNVLSGYNHRDAHDTHGHEHESETSVGKKKKKKKDDKKLRLSMYEIVLALREARKKR